MGNERPQQRRRGSDYRSLMASSELERLGINPIEKLHELAQMNIDAFKSGRGWSEKGDSGPAYLANAIRAYLEMAKFKYPTLSAVAIKDLGSGENTKAPMTTARAIEALKADPFAPKEIKEIQTESIVEAMKVPMDTPFLPSGNSEKES